MTITFKFFNLTETRNQGIRLQESIFKALTQLPIWLSRCNANRSRNKYFDFIAKHAHLVQYPPVLLCRTTTLITTNNLTALTCTPSTTPTTLPPYHSGSTTHTATVTTHITMTSTTYAASVITARTATADHVTSATTNRPALPSLSTPPWPSHRHHNTQLHHSPRPHITRLPPMPP